MAGRPEIPKGYLGAQPKFEEFGLSVVSHPNPEFSSDTNQIEVKVKFSKPVKVTANLTNCAKSEELPQNIFSQTRGDVITFYASLPETGFYKLQIFALPQSDESKTLLGVFNYLVNCTKITGPVLCYPKQYAQWKDGCYINSPISLCKDSNLSSVAFEAHVPGAKAVAVVAEGEWTPLEKNTSGLWAGNVGLEQYRGKDAKVTLNANYGEDNKYSTLLEYRV